MRCWQVDARSLPYCHLPFLTSVLKQEQQETPRLHPVLSGLKDNMLLIFKVLQIKNWKYDSSLTFAVENKTIRSNKFQIKSDLTLRRYYEIDVILGIKKLVKVHFYISADIYKRDGLVIPFFGCFFVNFIWYQIHHLKGTVQCFLVYLQCHINITAILFLSPQKETPSPLAVTPNSCLSSSPSKH